jgi:hypothetical protein
MGIAVGLRGRSTRGGKTCDKRQYNNNDDDDDDDDDNDGDNNNNI